MSINRLVIHSHENDGLWQACLQFYARYLFIIWLICILFAPSVQETINWISFGPEI